MPPGFLSRLQESAEPRRSQPNQEGASASHRATEEETQPSHDVAQRLFLPFPEEKVMRPNPGNVQQPTLPRRIWRGATRGRAGGSGRLEDGASPSWAPRRGRGRALLTSWNSAELANEPGARTWATPLAGRGRSPGDLFRTAGSEQSVSGSSRHLWPKDGRRPSAGTVEGAGGVCQEVLTLQLSRRVLDPGVSKGGVPQEPRVNAQHVWLSRQGRSASPSWVEAGMLLHPKTAPRTPVPGRRPGLDWAQERSSRVAMQALEECLRGVPAEPD